MDLFQLNPQPPPKTQLVVPEQAARAVKGEEVEEKDESNEINLDSDDDGIALGNQAAEAHQAAPKRKKRAAAKMKDHEEKRSRSRSMNKDLKSGRVSSSHGGRSRYEARMDPDTAKRLREMDPDMHEVATRLGYVPECFLNIQIESCFNPTCGRSIYQACSCLQCCTVGIVDRSRQVGLHVMC